MNLNIIDNIIWLGPSERILSVDFHPFQNILAIGGSQSPYLDDDEASQSYQDEQGYIKLWEFYPDNPKKQEQVKFIRGLQGHNKCVNGLRFSPNGQYLASCSDDNKIKIWEIKWVNKFGGIRQYTWDVISTLDGHSGEVLDIEWSSDGKYLVSAGFDKRSILWEVEKNKYICVLDGHKGPVKGISFDPLMKYIISQGDDRQVKNISRGEYKKKQQQQDAMESEDDQDISALSTNNQVTFPLFIQENSLSCFVKRPHWSPDGSLFLVPAAQYAENEGDKPKPCVLGFKRSQVNKPSLVFPTNGYPAIAIRFMKKLFKLEQGQEKILDLDYQAIFAIATTETVAIHSTQKRAPLVVVGNIHFALLNDLAWLSDRSLGICSTDGYCSFCNFKPGYFGQELSKEEYEQLGEDISNSMINESFYTQEQLEEWKNPQTQQQMPKIDFKISANTKVETFTDSQGVKKKKIIPVKITNIQQ